MDKRGKHIREELLTRFVTGESSSEEIKKVIELINSGELDKEYLYTIQKVWNATQLENLEKSIDVEAAIIFVLKFCDTHMFDTPQLTEELKALGFPVLSLEWDHLLSGFSQLRTRIQAFLEMVGGIQ